MMEGNEKEGKIEGQLHHIDIHWIERDEKEAKS